MPGVLRAVGTRVGSALLTISAVVGTLCLVSTVVAPLIGLRPLIFTSGSMAPAIPAGSLALAKTVNAEDLEIGDVVTVPLHGAFVTHRIVGITPGPGRATLILRGDGNSVDDADAYPVTSVPRTFVSVPHLGTFVAWFSHAPGVYVLAAWVAAVVSTLRRRGSSKDARPPAGGPGRPKLVLVIRRCLVRQQLARRPVVGHLARTAVTAMAVMASALTAPSPAMAAWVDAAVAVSGAQFTTAVPVAPVLSCAGSTGTTKTMSWTASPGATQYLVLYGPESPGPQLTATITAPATSMVMNTANGDPNSGIFWVRARLGSDTWVSAYSNRKGYTIGGADKCYDA